MRVVAFTDTFDDAIKALYLDAAANGISINQLCKRAGVSPHTPLSWGRRAPKTVRTLTQLQDELRRLKA